MRIFLILLMGLTVPLSAYDFKITVSWDEMAMMGEAESILQYYHGGKVEAIRGNLSKPSSDGNVEVNRTLSGNSQEFIIHKSAGHMFNIWVVNMVMDEDFASEEDFLMLSESKASILVEDRLNGQTYQLQVPENTPGLVFRGGAIVDGHFFEFTEMFKQQRIYQVSMVDAVYGDLLPGVNVVITNSRTGETVAMGKTDEFGMYSHKMDYGVYDVVFTKEGYLSSKHEFEMNLTELPVSMNFALTPIVREFRIVLTWGPFPKDLDAHLAGPKPEGGNFHIWWSNKVLIGGRDFLDVDDQNAYGPETITIYKPARGTYDYAVHNFSARRRKNSLDLSYSGAHVDVYADGRLQGTFNVPQGQRGNVWKVFSIDEQQRVIPVNKMYDESTSARVIH